MSTETDGARTAIPASPEERIREFIEEARPLAQRILDVLGLKQGTALHAGCGSAFVDVALAERAGCNFTLMDSSSLALDSAKETMEAFGFGSRATYLKGNEEDIPFVESGQQPRQITWLFDDGTRGCLQASPQRVGDDGGKRRLSKARRPA